MYYEINETTARRAREANSYREYKPGSATAEYRAQVDEAARIAEEQKRCTDPMYHEIIDHYLGLYTKKLADWYNKHFEIEARVPSIMVAGGSKFPVAKKEKQNAAREKHMEEYQYIQGLLGKIRGAGTAGISSDDENAIEKLEAKLADIECDQEHMKAVNAYYRKHNTLDGCPGLSTENAAAIKNNWESGWYKGVPFPAYSLSNNSANMRRVKERIAELKKRDESPDPVGWDFDGGRVLMNKDENRVQIIFDGKPDEDMRTELKGHGFRWAPSQGAWQRQLNNNGIYAAKQIKGIQPEREGNAL